MKMAEGSERTRAHRLTILMALEMLVEDKTALRTSMEYGIAKSTFHWRVEHWLKEDDWELYQKAKAHLKKTRAYHLNLYNKKGDEKNDYNKTG